MSVLGEEEDSDLNREGEGLPRPPDLPDLQDVTEMGVACLSGAIMLTTTE